jgi:hypothetical protein
LKYIIPGLLTLFMGILAVLPAAAPARADSGNVIPVAPAGIPALMLKVENTVQAGQPATITVFSRRSSETIAGATVYAIKTSGKAVPSGPGKSTIRDSELEASGEPDGIRFEDLAASEGILIGTTGSDGTLSAPLAGIGRYLLVATKDGYIPGFARLLVRGAGNQSKLDIKVVLNAIAGQPAGIQVTQKSDGQATENATVYALKMEIGKDLKLMPPTANNGKAVIGLAVGDAERARQNGVLVGRTDSSGRVSYSFPTPGQYILAAFKAGYGPGFTRINTRQLSALNPVPVPQAAVAQPLTQSHGDENEND